MIRLWEVASGKEQAVLDAGDRDPIIALAFLPDGRIACGTARGVQVWDVPTRTHTTLWAPPEDDPSFHVVQVIRSSGAGRIVFSYGNYPVGYAFVGDVDAASVRRLDSHGDRVYWATIDRTGEVVATASSDGIVRVGPASGGEPHLLLGHTGAVSSVAISPAGDWIASGGMDTTVRLWPMPDPSKPPAHTLPLAELLAKLKSQTNLRVVADPAAPNGYRTEPGPFPGWAVVPEWQP